MSKNISELLKQHRIKKGLSQIQLARRLGISYNCISQWECGYREATLVTAVRCLTACGYSQDQAILMWVNAHIKRYLNRNDLELALCLNGDRSMLVFEQDINAIAEEDDHDVFED